MNSFLVVDDSAFSRKVTAGYIKKFFPNSSLFYAPDGAAGLQEFMRTRPDCVFVDLLMPNMDGLDLIRRLKAQQCGSIVVVSADVQKSVRAEAESLGIAAFVNKPLNDEKMRQLLAALKES